MDHRDMAGRLPKRIYEDKGKLVVILHGEEYHELPLKYEVCLTCEGKGSHVNPSIDAHGISAEEFYEDPEFEESYFRGDYDVRCYACGGLRVVPVPDVEQMNNFQKEIWSTHLQEVEEDVAFEIECEAERRFGG